MSKKKRKFRAITNGEFCRKWKEIHIFCRKDDVKCPFYGVIDCRPSSFKKKPLKQECDFFDFILVCPNCKNRIVNVWSKRV